MYKTWMMKTLLLSTSLAMLAACNEKIAPELADPASTTTTSGSSGGGPTTPTTSTNVFSLELDTTPTSVSPVSLGYTLHKANELGTVKCQVEDVTDVPDTLDSTRDVTCFLEAEEFALFYNGFKVKAVSEADTCDFITTTPYSYYKLQPGVTARASGAPREVVKFVCTDTAKQLHGPQVLTGFGNNASGSTTVTELCGKYVNIDGSAAVGFGTLDLSATVTPVTLSSDSELCSFNYTDEGINCDEGAVRIHTVSVSSIPVAGVDTLTVIDGGSVLSSCGGNIRACVGGPAVELIGSADYLAGKTTSISDISTEGGFTNFLAPARDLTRASNIYMSNFLRQCSGMPNFTTAANFNTGTVFSPGYDAGIMEEYTRLGTTLPGTQEKDATYGQFDVITLADDPFRAGIPDDDVALFALNDPRRAWSNARLKARPFHTYECLDRALDVKARIRLVVREWNRNFSPLTQEFRYISDVFSASAKMDAGSAQTNPYLAYDAYNDVTDWDDLLQFTNSPTSSCVNSTMDDLGGTLPPLRSSLWFPGKSQ